MWLESRIIHSLVGLGGVGSPVSVWNVSTTELLIKVSLRSSSFRSSDEAKARRLGLDVNELDDLKSVHGFRVGWFSMYGIVTYIWLFIW